ncbi:MAG TPA: hypothetical protein VNA57_13445 [Acidimicrobiales bacterium]|nr:hypothetical protein [Acidimicrobiales bacterium]
MVALAIGLPAALAAGARSFGLPHSDDFTFSATAINYLRTSGFHLGGDEQMVLIGHVLWAQPFLRLFGAGPNALHLAGLVAAGLGLASCFLILRRLGHPRFALLGTSCVALLPGFALLAGTFMTDVTAFAAQMVCLALGLAALDRSGSTHIVLLASSSVFGVAAFSVRQTAIPALAAVAVAAIWQSAMLRRAWRAATVDLGVIAGGFIAIVAIALWRFGLQGQGQPPVAGPTVGNLFAVLAALSTLALFLSPLSWAAARSVIARPGGRGAAVVGAVLTLPWLILPIHGRDLLLGNLFTRRGANDGVIGGLKEDIFPSLAWVALQMVAVFGLLLLFTWAAQAAWAALPRRRRLIAGEGDPATVLLIVFTVLAFAAAVIPALRGANIFDRYLWAAGAGLTGILVRALPDERVPQRRIGAFLLLSILVVATGISITESISFDKARWRAGQQAVASNVPAGLVDAGYEWTGHHAKRPLTRERPVVVWTAPTWWSRAYAAGLPCVVVMGSPLDDARYALERTHSYDPPLSPRRQLLVYRLIEPCDSGAALDPP